MNKTQQNALLQRYEETLGLARAEERAIRKALVDALCELDLTKKALARARLPWWRRWFRKGKD